MSTLWISASARAAGIVTAYSFDFAASSSVPDVSGNGNTLSMLNGVQLAAGKYGLAATFDGNNDALIAISPNPALNLTGVGFTISAWINPRSNGGWQMIVNKPYTNGHSFPYFDWSMHRQTSSGRLVLFLGCDAGQRVSNATTPNNTWTHVAVSYDGSAIRHYINGNLDRTTPISCKVTNTNSRPIRIGSNGAGGEVMNGAIDDVRIYDRVLSATEIQGDMMTPLGDAGPSDTTPPTATVTAPVNNAVVSGTITLAADATDNIGVAGVQFQVDGLNVGAEDLTAPYAVNWNTTLVADGPHTVLAVARDAAGNRGTSAPVFVQTSNQANTPTVSLSANPTAVAYGGSSLLTWSSTNATTCNASGAWGGARATAGSASTGPLTAAINTFTLTCTGPGGSGVASAVVTVIPVVPAPTVFISANPTSVVSGASSTLTWSSTNATTCTASGAWSGARATAGSASTGPLTASINTFTLTCTGAGGSASHSAVVTVVPIMPPPTIALSATPTQVTSGSTSMLSWSTTNATACTASGGWAGPRATSGSESTPILTVTTTYTLTCTGPGGSLARSVTVTVVGGAQQSGLDFQGSAATTSTVRFHFTNPLAIYPATYIWRVKPRQQNGYFTTFFWGNNGTFFWDNGSPNSYYGAHPYPAQPPNGSTHKWEIAVDGGDYVSQEDVVHGVWYTQALRVWSDGSGKHHEFYWDLPNTSRVIRVDIRSSYGNTMPPAPVLVWGDAPWAASNEILNGVLRGIQVYSSTLTLSDVLAEVANPVSTPAGAANIWYLNINPTPTDIADRSGRGHHPVWVGELRPLLWSGD